VTVPEDWDGSVDGDPWTPPGADQTYSALSAGTSGDWADNPDGQGVFAGIMPGDDIPDQLPGHPECEEAEAPIEDTIDGDPARTIWYADCPGGVTVERVVQVAANRLLWVQVRSNDRAIATDVLSSVETSGL
jgi:hypothetical protein